MHRSISNRALLRSIVAGTLVLAGSWACSRPDRADPGAETSEPAVVASPADTQRAVTGTGDTDTAGTTHQATPTPPGQTPATDRGVSGYQPMGQDTLQNDTSPRAADRDVIDTVAVGDSAHIGKPGERLEGTESSEQANEDTLTNQSDSARIRPPEDTSETSGAAVGSSEMARDTSVAMGQGDTLVGTDTAQAAIDTTTTTTAQAQPADTAAFQVSVDTTTTGEQTEVAVENQPGMEPAIADTAVVVGDSAGVGKAGERLEPEIATAESNADTLATGAAPIRPPEDSTEVPGYVESTGKAAAGANAVAGMTRQGQDCSVVTGPEDVRWDMALSPATLNPCGTGTMTLPKIVTGEE